MYRIPKTNRETYLLSRFPGMEEDDKYDRFVSYMNMKFDVDLSGTTEIEFSISEYYISMTINKGTCGDLHRGLKEELDSIMAIYNEIKDSEFFLKVDTISLKEIE